MSIDTAIERLPAPPLARGLPVLGNMLEMQKDTVAFIVEQYKKLGPIFRVRALNQEFVVLAGPEANVFVTQERTDTFRSREAWGGFGREFNAERHMLALDGPPHAQMRKLVKPAYSVGTFLTDVPLLLDIIYKVLERFQVGEEVAVLHLMRLIVTEQLGRVLAGYAPGEHLPDIIKTIRLSLNVHVTKQMPAFMLKLPSYQRAKRGYLNVGREIVDAHRAGCSEKKDLVDDILAASQKPEFEGILSEEGQIVFAALGPFVAGLDTAANECTFMLYELFKHPDILARCEAEADELFAVGTPSEEQIRGRGVLHDAMMETLRLHPIAPAITRTANKDFVFAGHSVKEGQNIIIATSASHFLPELFPDPYAFDIERYGEERRENKQRGAYTPFGAGTHLCLGAGAAEAQIVLVLATLLHMVRLEFVHPEAKLRVKNDPTPTLGYAFHMRISERRR